MTPLIRKYDFYLYSDFRNGDNPLNLVQLIAHSNKILELENLSKDEGIQMQKNIKMCKLFFEDACSMRNGIVRFSIDEFDTKAAVDHYYNELLLYTSDSICESLRDKIENVKTIILDNFHTIKSFKGEEDEIESMNQLDSKFSNDKYSFKAIEIIAKDLHGNPNNYCRDEEGKEINVKFTGVLETYSKEGNILNKYTVHEGKIYGECIYYYSDGNIQEIANLDGYIKKESLKKWYSDGEVQFEKTKNYTRSWYNNKQIEHERMEGISRSWYKNGQLKIENRNGEVKKWDEDGNRRI